MEKRGRKIFAVILNLLIISMMIFSLTNVEAFAVNFSIKEKNVTKGDLATFNVTVDVNRADPFVKNFTLQLVSGNFKKVCIFDSQGVVLSDCSDITIIKTFGGLDGYSYGYGYGIGNVNFKIILNSANLKVGLYDITFITTTETGQTVKKDKLLIKEPTPTTLSGKGCSIRASDGIGTFNGTEFAKPKLSLFISAEKAKKGEGSLTMGRGNERVTVSLSQNNILSFNDTTLILKVQGDVKVKNKVVENLTGTIVTLDRIGNLMTITDINGKLLVDNMKVTFRKGC